MEILDHVSSEASSLGGAAHSQPKGEAPQTRALALAGATAASVSLDRQQCWLCKWPPALRLARPVGTAAVASSKHVLAPD